MLETISNDIKEAMKAKDKSRLDTLRMVKSRLLENKTSPKPKAELDVVIGYNKGLKNSLSEYPAGSEQAVKIEAEMKILAAYLPQALSRDEVVAMVEKIKSEDEAINFGGVMKQLSPMIKGRFDGKEASSLVKELLG